LSWSALHLQQALIALLNTKNELPSYIGGLGYTYWHTTNFIFGCFYIKPPNLH